MEDQSIEIGTVAKTKPLLALFAIAAIAAGVCACGGASTGTQSASHASSSAAPSSSTAATGASNNTSTTDYTKADSDKDNDIGAPHDDTNNNSELDFGHAANAADKRTVTALVKRYYATALAGDGAKACSMIYSTLAEAVPEDYGQPPGPLYMRGAKTCPAAMALLFKHFHTLLTLEVPKLEVTRVRLIEHHGYALLSFGELPEREILVAREGRVWTMNGLFDSELS
jgi:hypothetical protein